MKRVTPKQHNSDVKVTNNTSFLKKKFETVDIKQGGKKIPFNAFREFSDKSSLQIASDARDSINFKHNPSNSPDKTDGPKKKTVLLMRKAFVDKKGKLLGDNMAMIREDDRNSRRSQGFLGYKDEISPHAAHRA